MAIADVMMAWAMRSFFVGAFGDTDRRPVHQYSFFLNLHLHAG